MGGDTVIRDNQGGDLYLGEETVLAITGESLGEKAYVDITIHAGVLSQWVHGVYGYEGGDQHYILTAGDRSLTDPEPYGETEDTQTGEAPADSNVLLYVAVGIAALAVIAGAVLLLRKKKPAETETK